MSDFKVGDKIRYSKWSPDFWFVVQWVGDEFYAGVRESGRRCSMFKCSDLELWSPPFPFKAVLEWRVGTCSCHEEVHRGHGEQAP